MTKIQASQCLHTLALTDDPEEIRVTNHNSSFLSLSLFYEEKTLRTRQTYTSAVYDHHSAHACTYPGNAFKSDAELIITWISGHISFLESTAVEIVHTLKCWSKVESS